MADGDRLRADEFEAFRNIREILLNVTRQLEAGDLDSDVIDIHFRLDWPHGLMIQYFDVYEINEEIVHLISTARKGKPAGLTLRIASRVFLAEYVIGHTPASRMSFKSSLIIPKTNDECLIKTRLNFPSNFLDQNNPQSKH